MLILNVTKKKITAANAVPAVRFFTRLRGMIGREFKDFDAMYFPRCGSVHTFFMSRPIDLIFLNEKNNQVLRTVSCAVPWLPCIRAKGATSVLELPEGALLRSGTEAGDILDLNAELTEEIKQNWNQIYNREPAAAAFPMGER